MSLMPRIAFAAVAALTLACTAAPPPSRPAQTSTPVPTASGSAVTTASGAVSAAVPTPGRVVPPAPAGTRYAFTCEGARSFAAVFFPADQERATLTLEGRTIALKQERSASGVRYSDGGTLLLITKGADAYIEQGGQQTYRGCTGAPIEGGR